MTDGTAATVAGKAAGGGDPAATPAAPAAPARSWRPHGLYAVYGGLTALVLLNGAAIIVFRKDATNAVAAIGAISSPIVAMVSAYFGIKVGSQTGTATAAAADQARAVADNQVKSLLGHLDPTIAVPLMHALGINSVNPPADSGAAPGVPPQGQAPQQP